MTSKRPRNFLVIVVPLLCVVAAGCGPSSNEFVPPPPPEVTVTHPLKQVVTLFLEKTGQTEAVEQAEISSRVRGFIESIEFEAGATVEQDGLLYVIEKDQYKAQRDSDAAAVTAATAAIAVAKGTVAIAEAEVSRSTRELARQESLKAQNATSLAEYETSLAAKDSADANLTSAMAAVEAADAELQKAEAALAQSQLDLDYTEVRAPIPGEITKTDIKLGNLVQNGDVLASIVNSDRVFVNFTISDREALRLQRAEREKNAQSSRAAQATWDSIPVFVRREIDTNYKFEGNFDYIDRKGVDGGTGTIALRAEFDNESELLIPGLFVYVRIPFGAKESIVIPEKALARNNQGTFVLTVNGEHKVEAKAVIVGAKIDGWAIIREGLDETDRIVIEGLQRARPTTEVSPVLVPLKPADSPFLRTKAGEDPTSTESESSTSGDSPDADPSGGDSAGQNEGQANRDANAEASSDGVSR